MKRIEYSNPSVKRCSSCKLEKQLSEFNNDRNGRCGKSAICRGCSSIRGKKYRANSKEKIAAYRKAYRFKLDKDCTVDNCEGKSKDGAKYCSKHAQRLRKHGVFDIPNPLMPAKFMDRKCNTCSKLFRVSIANRNANLYCSWECYSAFRKSDMKYKLIEGEWYRSQCIDCRKPLKAVKAKRCIDCRREYIRKKTPLVVAGEERPDYHSLHHWVEKNLGKPRECSNCHRTDATRYHWANISKEYKWEIDDWVRLCPRCHKLFDLGKLDLKLGAR